MMMISQNTTAKKGRPLAERAPRVAFKLQRPRLDRRDIYAARDS